MIATSFVNKIVTFDKPQVGKTEDARDALWREDVMHCHQQLIIFIILRGLIKIGGDKTTLMITNIFNDPRHRASCLRGQLKMFMKMLIFFLFAYLKIQCHPYMGKLKIILKI